MKKVCSYHRFQVTTPNEEDTFGLTGDRLFAEWYLLFPSLKIKRFIMNNSIWLPNWRMQASLDSTITALENTAVSTASPFWYELSDSGELTCKPGSDGLSVPDNTTLKQLREYKGSIVPTVTTTFTPEAFIAFYSDVTHQNKMAHDLLKIAEENNYDGFDLDLETIALTTDASVAVRVRSVFTSLCGTVSKLMQLHNKLLVITVMARWSDDYEVWRDKLIPAVYDYGPLARFASVLRIMAYDQHAPGTPAGPIAGYQWVLKICEYTSQKVSDRQKIELGIPLYGRDWANGTATSVIYEKFVALKEKYPDSIVTYSEKEKEITFSYVDTSGEKHTVWFSNNQSVMDRIALIRSYQFRGAAFWAASYEERTLWQEIAQDQLSCAAVVLPR